MLRQKPSKNLSLFVGEVRELFRTFRVGYRYETPFRSVLLHFPGTCTFGAAIGQPGGCNCMPFSHAFGAGPVGRGPDGPRTGRTLPASCRESPPRWRRGESS